jgi:hypothetical protein
VKVAARVWRHVPPGAEPLHLGRIFRFSEGRWNVRGEYACLYTALTRDGALGELHRARAKRGSIVGPRDVVSIDIEIEPVLDLRDARKLEALSSAPKQIVVDNGPDRERVAPAPEALPGGVRTHRPPPPGI